MKPHNCPRCGTEYQVVYKPRNPLCEKCKYQDVRNQSITDSDSYLPEHQSFKDDDNLYI